MRNGQPWTPPAGYRLAAMATVQEPGFIVSLPFSAVIVRRARRHEPRKLVIVIRGTQTAQEWAIDYRRAPLPRGSGAGGQRAEV